MEKDNIENKELDAVIDEQEPETAEEKKAKGFGAFLQGAKNTFDKAKEAVGQGYDIAKEKGGQAIQIVKDKSEELGEQVAEAKRELDKRIINPVFLEDFYDDTFVVPNALRLFEEDKKMNNPVCENAIGFMDKFGDLRVLNVQIGHLPELFNENLLGGKLSFYPNIIESLYYCDPFSKRYFISLDEYFEYLKHAKIDELEKIAYDLGAKYFEVNYAEEKKSFASVKGKAKAEAGAKVDKIKAQYSDEYNGGVSYNSGYSYKLAKKSSFEGSNEPRMPKLLYYRNNADINNLIEMVMNGTHKVNSKTYMLNYESSIGINANIAKKMDAAIASYKYETNASVSAEVENEKRLKLEYKIEF